MAKVKVPTKKRPSKPRTLTHKPSSPGPPGPEKTSPAGPQGLPGAKQKADKGTTSPGNLGGTGIAGKGSSPAAALPSSGQLAKKSAMAALTVPEGIVMLPIAVFLDAIGLVLLILNFVFGVGLPISFMVSIIGSITIGTWAITRSFFRGAIEKAVSEISEKATGGGGQQQKPSSSLGGKTGKKAAKKGIKLSLSAIRLIVCAIIEIVPFLGNIFPSYTIFVIWELIQGEV